MYQPRDSRSALLHFSISFITSCLSSLHFFLSAASLASLCFFLGFDPFIAWLCSACCLDLDALHFSLLFLHSFSILVYHLRSTSCIASLRCVLQFTPLLTQLCYASLSAFIYSHLPFHHFLLVLVPLLAQLCSFSRLATLHFLLSYTLLLTELLSTPHLDSLSFLLNFFLPFTLLCSFLAQIYFPFHFVLHHFFLSLAPILHAFSALFSWLFSTFGLASLRFFILSASFFPPLLSRLCSTSPFNFSLLLT